MASTVLDRIRGSESLPSLPAVALKVLELTKNDNASMDELATVIQNDPALTAKILKVVNSPLFGMSRAVTSIKQAMNLLGWRTVRVMVLSFSLVDVMKKNEKASFDYQAYWRHSLTTGVAARLLAKATGSKMAEDAFVGGLLSNLGRLAAVRCVPELYEPVLSAAAASPGRAIHEIEAELLGVTHAQMGKELLAGWGLPETLCSAVATHHGDGLDQLTGPTSELASVVYSAASIAGVFCRDVPGAELERVKAECRSCTGVGEASLEQLLTVLDEQVKSAASMLSIQIGETASYAQIQTEAMSRLATLSVLAEVERVVSVQRETDARHESSRLQEERKQILEIASTDSLTRIPNRAAFDKRLDEELSRAASQATPIGLIMLDVDHFKKFNDDHGHQAGDAVLRSVGAAIGDVAKELGFAARYGGEEFAIIVAQQTAEAVMALADQLRKRIEATAVSHDSKTLRVTASVGVACVEKAQASLQPTQLIESADKVLYLAKKNGRNRVERAVDRPGSRA